MVFQHTDITIWNYGTIIILVNKRSKNHINLFHMMNILTFYVMVIYRVHPYVVSSQFNVRPTNLQADKRERWACQDQRKVYRNTAFSCKQMSSVVSTRWGTDENQIGGSGGAVISANLSEAVGIQNHKLHNQQQTRIIFYCKFSVVAILIF